MDQKSFDIIIIGAGAAGLMAAWELAQAGRSVAIIEAKERTGGRIHTVADPNFDLPVELGAEFIHGDLELTQMLLKKAGIASYELKGELWQKHEGELQQQEDFVEDYRPLNKKFKELKNDISVAEFISEYLQDDSFEDARFTLKNYVEGYAAADTFKASTFSLRDDLNSSDADQYRIEEGYGRLISYLEEECVKNGAEFFLSHAVDEVNWEKGKVTVSAAGEKFFSKILLTTVSLGVLQSEIIRFSPVLPKQMSAARSLGFGPVIKTMLQFEDAFWKDREITANKNLDKLNFIFSQALIPTWWTYYPKNAAMITGWSGGPHAARIQHLSDEEILQRGLDSLAEVFAIDSKELRQKLKAWYVANWTKENYIRGGYSYDVVNGEAAKRILIEPEEETLFFAGEGLVEGAEIGTVEAALKSGRETAHRIIAST